MVYILLGKGYEELEAIAPGDILRRARIPMQYVGIGGKIVAGSHGIAIEADIISEDMQLENMDMIVLPGGSDGVASIAADRYAMEALAYAVEHGKYVAAICAAPTLLADKGYLEGINAVCYPGLEPRMAGAILHPEQETVVDGSFITGRAPGAAVTFGLTLAGLLEGEYTPEEIAGYMVL